MSSFLQIILFFPSIYQIQHDLIEAKFSREQARKAAAFNTDNLNPDLQRQFRKIMDVGTSAQTDENKLQKVRKYLSPCLYLSYFNVSKVYTAELGICTRQICAFQRCYINSRLPRLTLFLELDLN